MTVFRAIVVWSGLAGVIVVTIIVAAGSEYLQYRSATYVTAGFAGVVALALLVTQPLLASGHLPGLTMLASRRIHRWTGAVLVLAVCVHVVGLWVTSPPDMVDALTFTAPTAFSVFGVVAMWAVFATALLAGFRRKLPVRPHIWRIAHTMAATIVVIGTVAHVLLIEGTMGTVTKVLMCMVSVGALVLAVRRLRPWVGLWRGRETPSRG